MGSPHSNEGVSTLRESSDCWYLGNPNRRAQNLEQPQLGHYPSSRLDETVKHNPHWKKRYGGRLRGETANSMVKDKGALRVGSCRAMGLAANNVGFLAYVVAHNLREAKGYAYQKQLIEDNRVQPPPAEPSSTPTRGGNNPRAPP